ncbi:hypothetical protein SFR_0616 [Streptomyces sp. FR-008]|nr:hypothetical protein SFR_0616 [Streptomyces sp. FR-008]
MARGRFRHVRHPRPRLGRNAHPSRPANPARDLHTSTPAATGPRGLNHVSIGAWWH